MNIKESALLMWVGAKFYSPEEFVKEAQEMGVSKRIGEIPKGLKLGETWVLLAHRKVAFYNNSIKDPKVGLRFEPDYKPAIFYAFQPQRIELLIWESDATPQRLEELKKKDITPVIVPDKEREHADLKHEKQWVKEELAKRT